MFIHLLLYKWVIPLGKYILEPATGKKRDHSSLSGDWVKVDYTQDAGGMEVLCITEEKFHKKAFKKNKPTCL